VGSGADYVLWPQHSPRQVEQLRKSGRWRVLYFDHVATLMVRAERPQVDALVPTPDSPWETWLWAGRACAAATTLPPQASSSEPCNICQACARPVKGSPTRNLSRADWPRLKPQSTVVSDVPGSGAPRAAPRVLRETSPHFQPSRIVAGDEIARKVRPRQFVR